MAAGFQQIYAIIRPYSSEKVLSFIFTNLPKHGTLLQDEKGMVYISIDNNYIHKLIEFIREEGFEIPPYFGTGLHGAHITVVTVEEAALHTVGTILEHGQRVRFEPKECQVVHPPAWAEGDLAYLITIEAPFLDELRQKYGLPKSRYDFHITIGVKRTGVTAA